MSFSGTNSTLAVRLKGAEIAGLSVAATAPEVRPWNALEKASTFVRPVWNEASFRGVLVRLRSRIAEEEAVIVVARCAAQFFGQGGLERVLDRVE